MSQQALLLNIVPFDSLSFLTGNAAKVGACLDGAVVVQGTDLDKVIDELRFMDASQMQRTLDQMQPSLFNAFNLTSQETLLNVEGILLSKYNTSSKRQCQTKTETHIWGNYLFNRSNQGNIENQVGFNTQTQAGLFGANWDFITNHQAGVMVGFARDDINWKEGRGNGTIDSYIEAILGSWTLGQFCYAQLGLLGAYQSFKGTRNILFEGGLFPTDTRKAKHADRGGAALAHLELGANPLKAEGPYIYSAPYLNVDYIYNYQSSFKETGANSINLSVDSQSADLLRFEAGLKTTRAFYSDEVDPCDQKRKGLFFAKIGAVREQRFLGKNTKAKLTGADCTLDVSGMNPDRWLYVAALGLSIFRKDALSLNLTGQGLWGSHYSSYLGDATVNFSF